MIDDELNFVFIGNGFHGIARVELRVKFNWMFSPKYLGTINPTSLHKESYRHSVVIL